MLSHLGANLRYTFRRAVRRKWTSAGILAAIALGSGATTALLTAVDRIVIRELPVNDPDRAFFVRTFDGNRLRIQSNPGDLYDIRNRMRSIAVLASYNESEQTVRVNESATPERLRVALVERGMLDALGMAPFLGAFFTDADYAGNGPNVVITHRFWRRYFNSERDAIGKTVLLNNVARTIIGVLPPGADALPEADYDIWRPLLDNTQQRTQARTATYFISIARLRDGVTPEAAQAELDAVSAQIAREQPLTNAVRRFVMVPLRDGVIGAAKPMFYLLGGAVAALLLIGCASVGNLLAARSNERTYELAVRAAMGGTSRRIVQQLLTEATALCVAGGLLGLVLAPAMLKFLVSMYPGGMPRAAEIAVDLRTLAVSLALIAATGVAATVPVMRRLWSIDLSDALRGGSRHTQSVAEHRVAGALVTVQLSLSIVLLFGGALLLKTYRTVAVINPGFDAEHVLTFDLAPSAVRYSTGEMVDAYYDQMFDRIRGLPGVKAVGVSNLIPFTTGNWSESIVRQGMNDAPPNSPFVKMQLVSDGFIDAIGLTLRKGRLIDARDRDSTARVMVINETFARELLPGREPLGEIIRTFNEAWQIVGVISDKRHSDIREAPIPEMFLPRTQRPRQLRAWAAVRTTGDPHALIPGVRRVAAEIDPTVAVARVATLDERRASTVSAERFRAVVVAAFGVVALLLATIGLYGIVSYAVTRRTREIGIRIALGQEPSSVRRDVMQRAAGYCAIGLSVGIIAALYLGRFLQSFLIDTSTRDSGALVATAMLFAGVTLLAAYLPARRASLTDPLTALRSD